MVPEFRGFQGIRVAVLFARRAVVKFVRTKDVLRMLGVSRTTLWRMVQAGMFPQPIVISKRATGHVHPKPMALW